MSKNLYRSSLETFVTFYTTRWAKKNISLDSHTDNTRERNDALALWTSKIKKKRELEPEALVVKVSIEYREIQNVFNLDKSWLLFTAHIESTFATIA